MFYEDVWSPFESNKKEIKEIDDKNIIEIIGQFDQLDQGVRKVFKAVVEIKNGKPREKFFEILGPLELNISI